MKNLRQMKAQPKHPVVRLALAATSILILSLAPTIVLAGPPATVASCSGIKDAYPILGTKCEKKYEQINHNPGDAEERLDTFNARVSVLEIFRMALLCNGMYEADKTTQQRFKSGEAGHLAALHNLHQAMINNNDPNIPDEFTSGDLNEITINKQQCK